MRHVAALARCLFAFPAMVLSAQVRREMSCPVTHIIHIGKTGGIFVKRFFAGLAAEEHTRLQLENHHFRLGDGPPEDCFAFFVRDPVERWISGFLEKLKRHWKGKATKEEQWAFQAFATPNDLAEALESTNETRRSEAQRANNAIEHTHNDFAHFLPNLADHLPRIIFVGETRNLSHDFETLLRKVGMSQLKVPAKAANVCPPKMEWMKAISPEAFANLRRLLGKDYEILETLREAGLIKSVVLERLHCVPPQTRCVVSAADGSFHMVDAQRTSRPNVYRLPNASRAEELQDWEDEDEEPSEEDATSAEEWEATREEDAATE